MMLSIIVAACLMWVRACVRALKQHAHIVRTLLLLQPLGVRTPPTRGFPCPEQVLKRELAPDTEAPQTYDEKERLLTKLLSPVTRAEACPAAHSARQCMFEARAPSGCAGACAHDPLSAKDPAYHPLYLCSLTLLRAVQEH